MINVHGMLSVSISKFKQSPKKVVKEARGQPVAVLNRNKPTFYIVSPELMVQIAELCEERHLAKLVRSRINAVHCAVKVSLDDL
jgi:antitoxin StbD